MSKHTDVNTKGRIEIRIVHPLDSKIDGFRRQRATMVSYAEMKLKAEDWHGVADAAMDLREIDARIVELEAARTVDPSAPRAGFGVPSVWTVAADKVSSLLDAAIAKQTKRAARAVRASTKVRR